MPNFSAKLNRGLRQALLSGLCVAAGCFAAASARATAFPELDAAKGFAMLALNGNIDQSGPFTGPQNVSGAIGIASSGFKYQGSGAQVDSGPFYIHSGSTFTTSASYNGPVLQNAATDTLLDNAKAAAYSTSTLYAAKTSTLSLGAVNSGQTVTKNTVGNYVYSISSIDLNHDSLILSAPAGSSIVLNISGTVHLSTGKIELAGGLTPRDVLINITSVGGNNFQTSGGIGDPSIVNGIILDPNGQVQLSPGVVNGEIIAQSISLSSGAQVIGMNMVPEANAGWVILPFLAAVLLWHSRKLLFRKPALAVIRHRLIVRETVFSV